MILDRGDILYVVCSIEQWFEGAIFLSRTYFSTVECVGNMGGLLLHKWHGEVQQASLVEHYYYITTTTTSVFDPHWVPHNCGLVRQS